MCKSYFQSKILKILQGQGIVLRAFCGLQRYSTNLYRPIGINFCFKAFPKQQFSLPYELLMCVTRLSKLYHSLFIGSKVENQT